MWWSPLVRRILIVGAGQAGRMLVGTLQELKLGSLSGVEPVGWIDDDERLQGQQIQGLKVLGNSQALYATATEQGIDEIVVAITAPAAICGELIKALVMCWERGISITPMALYYEELVGAVAIEHVGQNLFALVGPQSDLLLRIWDSVRRLSDIMLSIIGMIITVALLPFISFAIYIDCPGPILYCQERVGLAGARFRIYKFRSMIPEAEKNGAQWACVGDTRITRVGRFLRKTRLDELPQLWNLLKGDMTLIGPRPERPEFVNELCQLCPYYAIRHAVKPGLTGWAQVKFAYGNSHHDSMMKLQYDLYYLKHRGPILDSSILLRTINTVLRMKGT
jgi:exopolysaccharide biosynthesis polyprenyl glycosylphosphotransferase